MVRSNGLNALRRERLAKRLQVLHFESHVIYHAAGGGDVSDGLVPFPPEKIEAVADAGQVGANEEVRLSRPQSRVKHLHIPLLHLDVLLVDEVDMMRHDRRRVFLVARNQLDFGPVGADKIRKASIYRRRARCRWWWFARLRFSPCGLLISSGRQLSRHRRHVRHCETDVIEGGATCRASRLLYV